jgi:hypothetical protein
MQDMISAANVGATTRHPETPVEEMLNVTTDSLSDLASSNDDQHGDDVDDDEEHTDLGKLSDDDEPGWVMGTITKMVECSMVSFRQKQIRLEELTQPGWEDAANYIRERDKKYWTEE